MWDCGFICLVAHSSKRDNEPSCPIKHDVPDQLNGYQFLEMILIRVIKWLINHIDLINEPMGIF
jgi:hypothetical protein